MSDQMDDAQLNLSLRVNRFDGFREAFESVNAGDENILHAARLQLGDALHPEFRAFIVRCPDAQDFFESVHPDTEC